MAVLTIHYSCGGSSERRRKLIFSVNDETREVFDMVFYEGPCDPQTGEFISEPERRTVLGEDEIRGHIVGIRLKLKTENNIEGLTFRYPAKTQH